VYSQFVDDLISSVKNIAKKDEMVSSSAVFGHLFGPKITGLAYRQLLAWNVVDQIKFVGPCDGD